MNHNIKKNSKIVDELTTFLLKNGCNKITIELDYEIKKSTIVVKVNNLSPDLIELLTQTCTQERDLSIEEYGWELLGENDFSAELNLIGMLIDEFNIKNKDKSSILTLTRYH